MFKTLVLKIENAILTLKGNEMTVFVFDTCECISKTPKYRVFCILVYTQFQLFVFHGLGLRLQFGSIRIYGPL